MNTTMAFSNVIEACYDNKIKKVKHESATLPWNYKGDRGSVIFVVSPEKHVFFDSGMKCEPESVRLFSLILYLKVFYQQDKLLFIIDGYYNYPGASNIITQGPDETIDAGRFNAKRIISELPLKSLNNTKVKRKFNSLFKTMLKDFSLT